MTKRDAKWYRFYYRFQEMLSQDKWYMETIQESREGTGNGVRQESSLPFELNTLASRMADIECGKEDIFQLGQGILKTDAWFKWNTYRLHPSVIELRGLAKVVGMEPDFIIHDDVQPTAEDMGMTAIYIGSPEPVDHDDNLDAIRYAMETTRTIIGVDMAVEEDVHKYNTVSTSKEDYHFYLDELDDDLRAMLDEDVQADNYYLVTNWVDVVIGGFATNKNGYLTGLFSYIRGNGERIFKMRLAQAKLDAEAMAGEFLLFCAGDKLRNFYLAQGFMVQQVYRWNDDMAPKNWNYERFGRPNLYDMVKDIY